MSDSEDEVAFESADEGEGEGENEAEPKEKMKTKKSEKGGDHAGEPKQETEKKPESEKPETEPSSKSADPAGGDSESAPLASDIKGTPSGDGQQDQKDLEPAKETTDSDKSTPTDSKADEGAAQPTELPETEICETAKERDSDSPVTQDPSTTTPESEKSQPPSSEKTLSTDVKSEDAKSLEAESEEPSEDPKTRERTPTRKVERQGVKKEDPEDEKAEEHARVLDRLAGAADKKSGGWGWGGWGSSLLSTATSSVTTFTSSVEDGFNTIVESAEAALGALSPEELAAKQQEEKRDANDDTKDSQQENSDAPQSEKTSTTDKTGEDSESKDPSTKKKEVVVTTEPTGEEMKGREVDAEEGEEGQDKKETKEEDDDDGWFSWGTSPAAWGIQSGLTNVTNVVQKTSKTLVSGSLDVLETIGKKTYDVIAEGDHGLRQTIQKSGQKPNLSKMLKEAQEDAKAKAEQNAEYEESRKCHFGAQFDDFQGMVQLEALEMLSNQCEGKLHNLLGSLPADQLEPLKDELVTIKHAFEMDELESDDDEDKDHDFDRLMADYVGQLGLNTTAEKLIQVQEKGRKWLSDCMADQESDTQKSAKDIHETAIQSLAEFTARCVEQFHKIGQLTLLEKSVPVSSFKSKAHSLAEITKVLCAETGIISTKYTKCLNTAADDSEDPDSVTPLITNVYLEASNSGTYIQDAFQLLLPVLQQAVVETTQSNQLAS